MARIDDLIDEIRDEQLRKQLADAAHAVTGVHLRAQG